MVGNAAVAEATMAKAMIVFMVLSREKHKVPLKRPGLFEFACYRQPACMVQTKAWMLEYFVYMYMYIGGSYRYRSLVRVNGRILHVGSYQVGSYM